MRIVILLVAMLATTIVKGQNLVPNPSFEDTLNCAQGGGPNVCPPWFNPTAATPDYFTTNLNCGTNPYLAPVYQVPHTGIAFCGMFCYDTQGEREYLEVPLINPLDSAHNYCVSFYVVRANLSKYAIDKIGAYFSVDTLKSSNGFYLNVLPQIFNATGNIIYDTLNWVLIQGNFIASGGEKFLTIGTFYDNNSINIDSTSATFDAAYYQVDDVSVIDCTTGINEIKNSSQYISIYPNPFSKKTYIDISAIGNLKNNLKLRMFNSAGQEVFPSIDYNKSDIILNKNNLNEGIYYLKLTNSLNVFSKKIIIIN